MKRFELVDTTTGEFVPAITWVRRGWKGESYFMGFQQAFAVLAKDKEMTFEARRVLDLLFSKLDFENYVLVPQTAIAEELGIDKSNVSKAIRLLVEKGILLEGPKVDRSRSFRLNHNYGWKGTLKNLNKLRMVKAKNK